MSHVKALRLSIVLAVALTVVALAPAVAGAQTAKASHLRFGTGTTSTNWSGYDAVGGGFTSVTATWTVPTVVPGATDAYSSFWVGLDGDGSNSVEQIGTDSDSIGGKAVYEIWYEMYPKWPVYPELTIKAGDSITASVTTTGRGMFTLKLTDNTTKATFTTVQKMKKAKLYSAEVIGEAPWSGGVLPLANFGTVNFSSCAFNGKPISAYDWNGIDMVSGGVTKAATSALDSSGTGFSIAWKNF
jgi:hypothetical protein